ncbi:hypothetical protein Tco_1489482 [Tanacetum coccineum]
MLVQGSILQGEGSTVLVESHYTPTDEAASIGVDVRYGRAATTLTGLEARQGSGNIDKTPTMTASEIFTCLPSFIKSFKIGNGYPTKGRKIKQKRTKPSTEWKSVEKPKSNQRQSQIEAKVNPDKVKAKKSSSQKKYNFRDQICQILKLYKKDKYYKD